MKRFSRALFTALVVLTLAACGESGRKESTDGDLEVSQSVQEQSTVEETQEGETEGQAAEEKQQKSAQQLYEGFLAGEIPVHKGQTNYGVQDWDADKEIPYFIPVVDDGGYRLRDFVGRVNELESQYDKSIYVDAVNYAYLDIEKDGQQELALFVSNEHGAWSEGKSYVFLIKAVDGELQLIYRLESSELSWGYLGNPYGLICQSGYGEEGEYNNYFVLDDDGKEHFLYHVSYWYGMGEGYGYEEGIPAAADRIVKEDGLDDYYFEGIELIGYSFGIGEELSEQEVVYTYVDYCYDEDGNINLPAEKKERIEKAFAYAGKKCHTQEEIDALIQKKYLGLGLGTDVTVVQAQNYVEWTGLEPDAYWYGATVTVKDAKELMAAIADNTHILLEPGTYDLTEWLLEGNNLNRVPQYVYDEAYEGDNYAKIVYNGSDIADYEIVLNDLHNLTLESADVKNPAKIVCECPYARVISFEKCTNVSVEGLIMGHEIEPGYCSGDVLGFERCDIVKVKDCDLYGCGAYGIGLRNTYGTMITGGKIHDCTYGCIQANGCGWIEIDGMAFVDCKEYDMFSLYGCTFSFTNCSFKNLQGNMLGLSGGNGYVIFSNCQYDAAALDSIRNNEFFATNVNME